jgi:hypothetical protein
MKIMPTYSRPCRILTEMERPCIVPHEAAEKQLKFPYESLFRSMNLLLMDTVSSEHIFGTSAALVFTCGFAIRII